MKASGAADLVRLLRDRLGLDLPEVSYSDLESVGGNTSREVRYQRTRALLLRAARHPDQAGTLYDHPMLRLQVGGHLAYLEPDVVAFQVRGKFHVVEIKSFAVIDGQADEESVAAAAMQAAAYILALQDLLTAESLPAAAVSTDAILVTPENFSRQATATFLDVRKQVSILRRQLARMTRIGALLDELPPGLTFDLVPGPDGTYTRPRGELAAALEAVPARYQPRCLRTCELAGFCRDEARAAGALTVLGSVVRDDLGGLDIDQHRAGAGQRHPRAVRRPGRHRPCAAPRQEHQRQPGGRRGMTLLTTLARLEAAASGRARPLSRVRHRRLAAPAAGHHPADPGRRSRHPGRRHDRNQPLQPAAARRAAAPQPRAAAALPGQPGPDRAGLHRRPAAARPRCSPPPGTARSGAGTPTPRRSSCPTGRHGTTSACWAGRPGSSRPTGPTPSIPPCQSSGKWLTFLADSADHPGSALLADLTSLLAEHWATGQSPLEDASLAAQLAWIDPPPGMTGLQAALATEDPLRCPPAGPATDPGFDQAILEPLVRNHDRAAQAGSQAGADRAAAEITSRPPGPAGTDMGCGLARDLAAARAARDRLRQAAAGPPTGTPSPGSATISPTAACRSPAATTPPPPQPASTGSNAHRPPTTPNAPWRTRSSWPSCAPPGRRSPGR